MKILLISPLCPLPLEKGGAVRVWNIGKQLSKKHQVDLVCFIRSNDERKHESQLKEYFGDVQFILRREIASPRVLLERGLTKLNFFTKNWPLLRDGVFSSKSILSTLYAHPQLLELVKKVDQQKKYDLLYLETYYAGAAIAEHNCELHTPVLLCEQNIEYAAYARQSHQQANWVIRLLMQFDIWKMRREEVLWWKRAMHLAGLSRVDIAQMQQDSGREDISLLENGVDVGWFSQQKWMRREREVLFVGSFTYFPNVDALKWLLEEIWPQVLNKLSEDVGQVRLRVVGRGADASLKDFVQSKGYQIDASVGDIREAFQTASLLLAPIRAGSGTKYKILEAMASHCPVITTSIGAEGLEVSADREMIIADNADELAEQAAKLLSCEESARQRLAENGYQFVKKHYDWVNVLDGFERKIQN